MHWPSTALGDLKAHLNTHGLPCGTAHLHLEIACILGIELYQSVSQEWELGEALYACLLEPGERERLLTPVVDKLRKSGASALADWVGRSAVEDVASATEIAINRLNLSGVSVVGISIGALQLASSIYATRMLKKRKSDLFVVLGGSALVGEVGRNLLLAVPEIDAVVDGEGEEALLQLVQLRQPVCAEALSQIPNLWYRDGNGEVKRSFARALVELDQAAIPDYSEFYDSLSFRQVPAKLFILPIEASRGCAWEHRCGNELRGCTFCGLYRNSPNYREKGFARILTEINELTKRFKMLDLAFVDAYLPDSYRTELLVALSQGTADVTLFCELRCDLDDETAALLARAGAIRVQLGVESFSTSILRRIDKGTKTIDNILSMKLCEEYGIGYQYNVMTYIPGVTVHEISEMIQVLPLLFGYRPPSLSEFYLDRGSRMYKSPTDFGLVPEHLDCAPVSFLPSRLASKKITQNVPFKHDFVKEGTDKLWKSVATIVEHWKETRKEVGRAGLKSPLFYRDGGEFLSVTDCRDRTKTTITLEGFCRDLFLACDRPASLSQLTERFPNIDPDQIRFTMDTLIRERLVYNERQRYLALPVRLSRQRGFTRVWDLGLS